MLKNVRVTPKILAIVMLGIVCIGLVSGYSLYQLKAVMIEDRRQTIRGIVDQATETLKFYQAQVAAGTIDEKPAQLQARNELRSVRLSNSAYVVIYSVDGVVLVHPSPKIEGTKTDQAVDKFGFHFGEKQIEIAKAGGGYLTYWWPKPGANETPFEKTAYVTEFKPWGWVLAVSLYMDDVDAAFATNALILIAATLISLMLLVGFSFVIGPINYTTYQ